MATNLKVTELDFDQIKLNLKNYLKTQSTFNDYDFEGSGLSVLLDVLSYNTHYNAMAAHFALNEAFLDSAQIRGNVVSRANLLGYTPRSKLASRATINVTVNVTGIADTPQTLSLPRGTKFTSIVDGSEYNFVATETQTASKVNSIYTFTNVPIAEGIYKTLKFRVDNDLDTQKFQISDKDVDTSTLRVRVQANQESTAYDIYSKFTTLLNVISTSKIYHLQENSNEYYEIYFGDGITGFKPTNNNIVTVDYVYTNGKDANGASAFSKVDNIGGYSNITLTTVTNATGGADQETMESIRYNAPLTFTSQNRAVTSDDYRAIIQREFSDIDALSTWGGEDNNPPDYGAIYVCVKPVLADKLTDDQKSEIKNTILKGKNVVSITPTLVDPNYTYLDLDVFFKYNNNLTDRSSVELESVVRDTIDDYNFNNLNKFDGVFRHSQLLKAIDSADPSIQNSTVRPFMHKTITPLATTALNNHTLNFTGAFYVSGSTKDSVISSSAFKINGADHYFGDEEVEGQTARRVYVYKLVNGVEVKAISDCGTVTTATGQVVLNNFVPTNANGTFSNTDIKITIKPDSLDIAPKRDQLLNISAAGVLIYPEIDTIAVSGSTGSIDYTTTSRFRS
jgi:hypothetical protein